MIALCRPAKNGAARILADGTIEFKASKGFAGRASLVFTVQDALKASKSEIKL